MKIIDMHCDTLVKCWKNPELNILSGDTAITLERLKKNDSMAQFFAMYLPREYLKEMSAYEILKNTYSYYEKIIAENGDVIKSAYNAEDIMKNVNDGFLSAILTAEDGSFIDGKLERVDEAYKMGIRLITLIMNYENSIGYPNSADEEIHQKRLKPFGFEVIDKMNDLGMIVDVSHLSEGGFYDVAKCSKVPFVASHSCARALCNHQRNLTDRQLKTIGDAGGVVGVNFERTFLKEQSDATTIAQIMKQVMYIRDKAGIDAVGFGSDFDGIMPSGEVRTYDSFNSIIDEMSKKLSDDEIEKICNRNVLRVMREIMHTQ